MLERYGHGGDLESASELYGGHRAFLDFSANINPLGPPQEVVERLQDSIGAIIRYPDPGHRRFKDLLSVRLGVDPSCISVGNGAAESMALLLQALAPEKVGVVEPCFSEYRQLSEQCGAEVYSVHGKKELQWRAEANEIVKLLGQVDLLFLGQPNNPNGVMYDKEVLHEIAAAANRLGTYLVIDEAFIDFIPESKRQSLVSELNQYPHLILVRSMTKFYAIPGLRLGYALGHADVVQRMTSKQVTWSVNGLALLAGEACLEGDEAYERETMELIAKEREWLVHALTRLGIEVTAGEANFLLAALPSPWTAEELQRRLGLRGILIRSCSMYPGLGAPYIRIAVKDRGPNERLLHELEAVFKEREQEITS